MRGFSRYLLVFICMFSLILSVGCNGGDLAGNDAGTSSETETGSEITESEEIADASDVETADNEDVTEPPVTFAETEYPDTGYDPSEWTTNIAEGVSGAYTDILVNFRALADGMLSADFEDDYNSGKFPCPNYMSEYDLDYRWDRMAVETYTELRQSDDPGITSFGYSVKDINGDGVSELFLLCYDVIIASFTSVAGETYMLDAHSRDYTGVILQAGEYFTHKNNGNDFEYVVKKLDDSSNTFTEVIKFGYETEWNDVLNAEVYYKIVEDEKTTIDKAEFDSILESYLYEEYKLDVVPIAVKVFT